MDQYNLGFRQTQQSIIMKCLGWAGQVGRGDAGLTKLPGSLIVCVFGSIRQVLDYNGNLSLTTSYNQLPPVENNDGNTQLNPL